MRQLKEMGFETGGGTPCPEGPAIPARLRERVANRCAVAAAWAVGGTIWAAVLAWMALAG